MPNKLQAAQHLTYILNVVAPLPGKDPITLRSHSPYGPFHKNDVFYNAVGASGAVAAVLFASILLYPTGKIFFFLIPDKTFFSSTPLS